MVANPSKPWSLDFHKPFIFLCKQGERLLPGSAISFSPGCCTLPFVIHFLRRDDFVEDRSEGLVLSDHMGSYQWGHDELALSDVRFHGNPEKNNRDREADRLTSNILCEKKAANTWFPNIFSLKDSTGFFLSFFTCTNPMEIHLNLYSHQMSQALSSGVPQRLHRLTSDQLT